MIIEEIISKFNKEFRCKVTHIITAPTPRFYDGVEKINELDGCGDIQVSMNPFYPPQLIALLRKCPLTDQFVHWKVYDVSERPCTPHDQVIGFYENLEDVLGKVERQHCDLDHTPNAKTIESLKQECSGSFKDFKELIDHLEKEE